MEAHGINPNKHIIAIIPARFASVRLEGKLLLPIGGKPLILYTLEQTKKARYISRVIVATDDERIFQAVAESGNEAWMTRPNHQSGSDRIAEVAERLPASSLIVNVQGDEPLISPRTIESAIEAMFEDETADMATTSEPIERDEDVFDPNVVKVVTDQRGYALYFSRSPIPYLPADAKRLGNLAAALLNDRAVISSYRKHTGLYVYRREFLLRFTALSPSPLEKSEMLEQLRALENGAKIRVVDVSESSVGVDTKEDFDIVRGIIESRG